MLSYLTILKFKNAKSVMDLGDAIESIDPRGDEKS